MQQNNHCTWNHIAKVSPHYLVKCLSSYAKTAPTEGCEACIATAKQQNASACVNILGRLKLQDWTMTDDLRTGEIWLVIDAVDQ